MKDEEKQQSATREEKGAGNALRKWTRKGWFWPAVYLSACAVLLGAYFLIQSPAGTDQAEENGSFGDEQEWNNESGEGEDSVPTAGEGETLQMPVMDEESVDIIGYYYDHDAAAEEQQDALVYYNNMYYQNKGIDIAANDGESFEVTAAATGEVVKAEKDDVLGHVVDIKHANDIVTSYNSLEDLQVEEGDTVTQGSVIGSAGRNVYNSDAGVHAHFEVRMNGEPLNPSDVFHQKVKDIKQPEESEDNKEADTQEETSQEDESSLDEFPIIGGDDEEESDTEEDADNSDASNEEDTNEDNEEE
ncbi:stage II sporulation protein Q [Alteribacillus persepolensis]|uniref:Stage II sporulation protein Q n=1 Tax=Alteribacillus persepolensis TaxID=568899 RepID=A0A1G8HAY8_9BACI|nr:M23 family metallopeptidase [Alteribacillus persepolensis]SDI03802.1 stage II sporulation protein Q [Alteribacillus persepolensis]